MPKYKVQSYDLKVIFESDEELDFNQAVAKALELENPEQLSTFISVKFYGQTPGKRIDSVDNDYYAITENVLKELGLLAEKPCDTTSTQSS